MTTALRDDPTVTGIEAGPADNAGKARLAKAARKKAALVYSLRLTALLAFFALWEASVRFGIVDEFYVSRPAIVVSFLGEYLNGPNFLPDVLATVKETLGGFAIGAVLGVIGGLMLGRFELLELVVRPFIAAIQSLPKVALAPMFILWFGLGSASKIYLGAAVVFFIVLVSTEAGVRTIEPDLKMTTRALAATERQLYLKVVLPGSVPSIFAGLRLGAVYALLAAIVGEMIAARQGLGLRITYYSQTFVAEGVFGILVVIAVFASSFSALLIFLERRLLRWQQ